MQSSSINSRLRAALRGKQAPTATAFFGLIALFCCTSAALAARRPGAARALRVNGTTANGFSWQSGQPSAGSLLQPAFGKVEDGSANLFFTRQAEGTRNLWRAKIPMRAPVAASTGGDTDEAPAPVKANPIEAQPITSFTAPFFAASAAPLPDGRSLLCVTNTGIGQADAAAGHTCIARLDLRNERLTPLTDGKTVDGAPTVSPDGLSFAFVSNRDGAFSIYVMPVRGGDAQQVAIMARYPCWLDSNTLIYESLRPISAGLYRYSLERKSKNGPLIAGKSAPQFLWKRAGTVAASRGGRWLCLAASTPAIGSSVTIGTRLYLLAPDGTGIRAIPQTEGVGSASFAPDDSVVAFDAPLRSDGADTRGKEEAHTLWSLPMLPSPPAATITGIRPVRADNSIPATSLNAPLEIWGTVFSEGNIAPQVTLEWGEGAEPEAWSPLVVNNLMANNSPLARWNPPAAPGDYTLRLTVVDGDGDRAQSTFNVTLPLDEAHAAALDTQSPLFAAIIPNVIPRVAEAAPLPATVPKPQDTATVSPQAIAPQTVAAPAIPAIAAPATAPKQTLLPALPQPNLPQPTEKLSLEKQHIASPVPFLPLPALPSAPASTPAQGETSPWAPGTRAPESATDPAPPLMQELPEQASQTQPASASRYEKRKPEKSRRQPRTGASARPVERPAADNAPRVAAGDSAVVTISGVPLTMRAGQTAPLVAILRNTGTSGWRMESDAPVRLLIYWRDLTTGSRSRWNIRWLRAEVPPGGSTSLSIDLVAPARSGHFQLRFCLVRVPGGSYTPPSISSATMPGEFGVASTTMDVS